jgi:septal ring factor EnvC (AmiA/AmiB activator)
LGLTALLRFFYVLGLATLGMLTTNGHAAKNDAPDLQKLRATLNALERELSDTKAERDQTRESLRKHERQIGELVKTQQELSTELKWQAQRTQVLRRDSANERRALAQEKSRLAEDVRRAHRAGREPLLKLLLNQEDPNRAARNLSTYRYWLAARQARVEHFRAALVKLDTFEQEARTTQNVLATLKKLEHEKLLELQKEQAERTKLLAQLNARVKNRSEEIERLRANQARLERVVGVLRESLPVTSAPDESVSERAGDKTRRAWPVVGKVVHRFGEPKNMGDLRWRGVFIETVEGKPVRAVANGRVVYADWLRGFGLLLIMDHADGYMTLVGHNLSLAKKVGERVQSGEVIATAGNSGDTARTGVYFEMRYLGVPIDPEKGFAEPSRTAKGRRR